MPFRQEEEDEDEVVVVMGKEDGNVSESNDLNHHSIIRYGESLVFRSVLTYKNISCKSRDDERGEDEENVLYQGKKWSSVFVAVKVSDFRELCMSSSGGRCGIGWAMFE